MCVSDSSFSLVSIYHKMAGFSGNSHHELPPTLQLEEEAGWVPIILTGSGLVCSLCDCIARGRVCTDMPICRGHQRSSCWSSHSSQVGCLSLCPAPGVLERQGHIGDPVTGAWGLTGTLN